ncbi:OB-fold nucleic acid binding domain-containing protein, partial [Streptococcus suis]
NRATVLVQIQAIRLIRTKKTGEQMAFLRVTDTKRTLDVTLFPESYRQYASILEEGGMGYITGRVQERDGQLQLVLEKLEPISLEKFWILLENR